MKHRTTTPFFNTLINTTMNLCSFLNGTDQSVAVKWMMNSITKKLGNDLIHPCPYFGEFKITNLTVVNAQSAQFLLGRYRVTIRIFDDLDENILTAIHEVDLLWTTFRQQNFPPELSFPGLNIYEFGIKPSQLTFRCQLTTWVDTERWSSRFALKFATKLFIWVMLHGKTTWHQTSLVMLKFVAISERFSKCSLFAMSCGWQRWKFTQRSELVGGAVRARISRCSKL